MTTRKPNVKMPSIEECLFGPNKYFPSHILLDPDRDASWTPPSSPEQKKNAYRPKLQKDYHSVSDIGSLSAPQQVEHHTRKAQVAQMATFELEEDRWSQRAGESIMQSVTEPSPHTIELQELRRLSSQGITDQGSHRAVAWRVLLGYLPPDVMQWKDVMKRDRALYRKLVAGLFIKPDEVQGDEGKKTAAADNNAVGGMTAIQEDEESEDDEESENEEEPQMNGEKDKDESENADETPEMNGEETDDEHFENYTTGNEEQDRVDLNLQSLNLNGNVQGNGEFASSEDGKADVRSSRARPGLGEKRASEVVRNLYEEAKGPLFQLDVPDGQAPQRYSTMNSLAQGSKAAQFAENAALLDEIRKDVVRTHPDLFFFQEPEENLGKRRYAALERILFVWAKLNKGVRYVQGMNEIVGTIYFVLANDFNEEWACEAEADAYFLFNALMVEMRDVFVPDLDDADTGIQGRIQNMMQLLSLHDPEVRCHLDDCGVDASFYCIRWLTTLLSREFMLPDTIRLWDSMFASTHKDNFLRYVCVTMVMAIRDDLLKGDFSTCLRLLQSYPPIHVETLLEASRALWIYESQVTLACHKGGISLQQALQAIVPPPAIIMAYGLPDGAAIRRGTDQQRNAGFGSVKDATTSAATAGMGFLRGFGRKKTFEK